MMRPSGSRPLAVAAIVLLLAGAGCSRDKKKQGPTSRTFSGTEVQQVIDRDLPRTFEGMRVSPSRCPSTLDPQQDKPVNCSLPVEGVPVRIRVDRVDANSFKVASDQAVIPLSKLESALASEVTKTAKQVASADCGDEAVKVFDPPGKLTCTAVLASAPPVKLVVTVSDKQGNFTFEEEEKPS